MLFKFLANIYTAGKTFDDAKPKIEALIARGFSVTSDILGEFTKDPNQIKSVVAEYGGHIRTLGLLQKARGTGNVLSLAIKPSRIGLELSALHFINNLTKILRVAKECGIFIWIDAEKKKDRAIVLQTVLQMHNQGFRNIGLAVQCVHSDAKEVAKKLWEEHIAIRLVMGAYTDCDLKKKKDIIKNFKDVFWSALYYYKNSKEKGIVALASHNSEVVGYGLVFYNDPDLRGVIQIQMLYGIRSKWQMELVALGYNFLVYVPWGPNWFGYLMRRISEGVVGPSALWMFLRNIPEARKYGV